MSFKSGVEHVCLHPGGTAALEAVKRNLGLDDAAPVVVVRAVVHGGQGEADK
jgi:hypothetical protein